MWDTLKWLEGPDLVVAFQRLCGIVPRPSPTPVNMIKTEQNGFHILNGSQKRDALENDSSVHIENNRNKSGGFGDAKNGFVYKLRSRNIISPTNHKANSKTLGQAPFVNQFENCVDTKPTLSEIKNGLVPEKGIEDDSAEESESSSSGSEAEDVQSDCLILNKFLYYLFCFGANLGNEVFYCAFFPFWLWNVDGYVCRRVCIIWCFVMYFGQAAKDIIRWPRPASPPVVRMEKRYELEYGMPSTHAMVGFAVPVSLLLFTWNRYEYENVSAFLLCMAWCTLVCLSRLYLGMHTVLDVICGILFSVLILAILHPLVDTIDNFILTSPKSPMVVIVVSLTMCFLYPTLDKWSTARGDTTMILAVGVGVALGSWVNYQWEIYHITMDLPPYKIKVPNAEYFGTMVMRTILGIVILIATRTVMKTLTYQTLCFLFGKKREDVKSQQYLIVELPYKYITYTAVAFNVVYFAPVVFRYVGIERVTLHTEY